MPKMETNENYSLKLSITIVNYNTKNLLEQCLSSIYKNIIGLSVEVFVVDNGSSDGSTDMVIKKFPKTFLIKNSTNLFYSKACNQALKKCQGKYIAMINSDTVMLPSTLKRMYAFMEKHPDIGAASCKHVSPYGKVDNTCSRIPTPLLEFFESSLLAKPIKNRQLILYYRYGDWKRDTTREVDVLPGPFIITRSSIIKKIGMLDERIKLFYNDTDLCMRIKKAGFALYYNADCAIIHKQAQTIKKLNSWELYKCVEHDMFMFYKKYYGFFWWLFLWLAFRPNWLYWKLVTFKNNEV